MKRAAWAALLAIGVAAGLWLFRPAPPEVAGPADVSAPQASPASPMPAPASDQPAPAAAPDQGQESRHASPPAIAAPTPAFAPGSPEAVAEGIRLREEAQQLFKKFKAFEAIDLFEKAIAVDPSADNHAALGRVLRDLTVIEKALYHLRAAADRDPGNADRWIELANTYYRKPDPGLAWEAEKRAKEAEPGIQLRRVHGKIERAGDSAPAGE